MLQKLHKNAKTNYHIRETIRNSTKSVSELSREYHLSRRTVRKWKYRQKVEDKSSRPDSLRTLLTVAQEDRILLERKQFKKSIEEIYLTLEEEIPNLYMMKVYRCLVRYGLGVLPEEFVRAEKQIKKYKQYDKGFLHIDTLISPKIKGKRYYIFTCIDRITKVAYVWVTERKTKEMGAAFLQRVLAYYAYQINYILTDNGPEFTYKFLPKKRQTKKEHPFDTICKEKKIEHRLIKFRHPWTNGMVERFNGKVKTKVIKRYLFEGREDLNREILAYCNRYNFEIRLRQLQYQTPANYLQSTYHLCIQPIVI